MIYHLSYLIDLMLYQYNYKIYSLMSIFHRCESARSIFVISGMAEMIWIADVLSIQSDARWCPDWKNCAVDEKHGQGRASFLRFFVPLCLSRTPFFSPTVRSANSSAIMESRFAMFSSRGDSWQQLSSMWVSGMKCEMYTGLYPEPVHI